MSKISPTRLLLALAVGVLLLLVLVLAVLLTDTLVNIWHNLRDAPDWLVILVLSALGLLSLLSGWALARLLMPKKQLLRQADSVQKIDKASLEQRLETAKEQGLETGFADMELQQLEQRRAAGKIFIALFGEISSGKSSLIKALLPDSRVEINVAGGTTRELSEYHWTSPAGDELVITDMPGLNETAGSQDLLAREEALRAHIVIYLVDGDLTRSQAGELKDLLALDKPCILALNKIDRLNEEQLAQITSALQAKVDMLGAAEVVTISTGGKQTVIRVLHDGSEEAMERQLPPIMEPLQLAVQRIVDNQSNTLDQLRDSSVFVLVSRQLDSALQAHRSEQAEQLVHSYARKAVVGAIAAMTPGTDILIQGYLASQMVRELSSLYGISVRKMDMDLLLKLIQKHVRTHSTILLAIAGNGLKAFPGVGTLAGGALHAVAYGFLFESLGKSVALSLESRGELHPLQVANQFEESLGEDIKASAGRYARLAFEEISKKD
jgi:GTP-binding protein EngB required for normal cell division/uncharacterized protein (DUF697 family)